MASRAHPGTPAKQPWSESKRAFHRQACKDKEKLSLGQKLEIVHRALSKSDSEAFRTQAQLAVMFKKSRSAISKILRPENVQKLRQVAATGMHLDVKRHSWRDSSVQFLDLERRVHEFVLANTTEEEGTPCSSTVCQHAEELAREIGVENFKGTYGWFTRFMRRHGLSSSMKDKTPAQASAYLEPVEPGVPIVSRPTVSALDVSSSGSGDSHSRAASIDSSASTLAEAGQGKCDDFDAHASMMPAMPSSLPAAQFPMQILAASEAAPVHGYYDYSNYSARRPTDPDHLDFVLEGWQRQCIVFQKITSNVKVSFQTPTGKVQRRMQISLPVDESCGRVNGFNILYSILLSAFHDDIERAGCTGMLRLSYLDEEGDQIAISNDDELGIALHSAMYSASPICGTTLRLILNVF